MHEALFKKHTREWRVQPLGLPHDAVHELHVEERLCGHHTAVSCEDPANLVTQCFHGFGLGSKVVEAIYGCYTCEFPNTKPHGPGFRTHSHSSGGERRGMDGGHSEQQLHVRDIGQVGDTSIVGPVEQPLQSVVGKLLARRLETLSLVDHGA